MSFLFENPYVALWSHAFAFTLGVELVVATPLLARSGASRARRLAAVAVANIASHPAGWFIIPELHLGNSATLVVAETWAVLLELAIYVLVFPSLGARRAAVVSFAANAASFGLGLILRSMTGWV